MARAGAFALPTCRDEKAKSRQPDTQPVRRVAAALQFDSAAPGSEAGAADRRFRRVIHVVDSTTIELVASCMDWAKHRRRKAAAKCHLRLDLQSFLPRFAIIDTARDNDARRRAKSAPASALARSFSLTRPTWTSTTSLISSSAGFSGSPAPRTTSFQGRRAHCRLPGRQDPAR